MKNKLLLFLLLFSTLAFSQIPSYYNDVNLNQSGTALKDDLAVKIISTHTTFLSYTPGVWTTLESADLDLTNSNNVLLLYGYNDTDGIEKTDRSRGKFDHGSGIGLWNREHSFPKSLGIPNLGTTGPGSDAHHLRACDGQMNSTRNNRKYADGSGDAGITPESNFYPGDEWKGDVARMMLYMYLRYDDRCLPSFVGVGNAVPGDANMVDLFLQWNVDDPVNAYEDQRNEVIANAQGNRNPFIDNPAFATQIWAGPQAEDRFGTGITDTEAPSIPASLIASNTTSSATVLSWSAATDNIGVTGYDVFQNGSYITTASTTSYNVSGLTASTSYVFSVQARDQAGNTSANSNSASIMTLEGGGSSSASELFISEYIEGSSNNKALEVANFTGAAIDLSSYSLKKATNGGGAFSSTVALSGTLANGDVFVIANSSATAAILNEADATNSGVMTFNGNDAVGLFKNDVLIDLLGDENSSANYAQNVTLQRKSAIISPNTSYVTTEWNTFSTDTFSDLGTHTIDGGTPPADTEAPSVPVNMIAANITETTVDLTWTAATDNTAVTGYDVYQDGLLLTSVSGTTYAVTNLVSAITYAFAVSAKDAAGNESATSNPVNVTTETPADTQAPTVPTNVVASNITQTTVDLTWTAATDNVGVANYQVLQDGVSIATVTATSYAVSNLTANSFYNFTISATDAAGNTSANSNSASIMTLEGGGGSLASELFISEYIEGSSNNKALEVANFTGAAIDLSSYSLKKATNGGGAFSSTVALSGTLANGDVFVIANSSATAAILNEADATNSGVMTFNGDDAIGLFKNDVLIDLLGDENSTAIFAQNVTLQRKSAIISPNTSYVTTEWNTFSTDTFSGLGTHTIDGGTPPADTEAPSVPNNMIAANITETTVDLSWAAATDNTAVTGYDVYQDGLLIISVSGTTYAVSNLASASTYAFAVSAKDAAGNESATSNPVNVTTETPADTQAPTVPANVVASNITQTTVDLTWTAATDNIGVANYQVLQDGVSIATVTATNYSVSNLTADSFYNFTISAADAAGNTSAESNAVTVLTESTPTSSTTVVSESYFENGWDNWSDGGSDCARYSGSRSYEGSYSIRLRDNSGTKSAMTSSTYDLTSFDAVEVSFYFYSYSMENNEDFWLRYNDGSSWTTVETYASGTDFDNNNFYQATVILDAANYNFANNSQFRFQADASGNGDHIYIDQVVITGTTGAAARDSDNNSDNTVTYIKHLNTDMFEMFEEDIKLYPNPVTGGVLNVRLSDELVETVTYRIFSIVGQEVAQGELTRNHIAVNTLKPGLYILEINDGEEIMTKKFIKD